MKTLTPGWKAAIGAGLFICSMASHAYTDTEALGATASAANFAKVANAVAARLFELGPRFTAVYPLGTPPTTNLLWLKDPNNCLLSGIPSLPLKENGQPVSASFIPCNTPDTDNWGNTYSISWAGTYPLLTISIQLGGTPYRVNGIDRGDIGGLISLAAANYSTATTLGYSGAVFVGYNYSATTNQLVATVQRTGSALDDGRLNTDGSNSMDSTAPIHWGNGMSVDPETDGSMTLNASHVNIDQMNGNSANFSGQLTSNQAAITGTLQASNIVSSGPLNGSVLTLSTSSTSGGSCSTGQVSRATDGSLLSCVNGIWTAGSGFSRVIGTCTSSSCDLGAHKACTVMRPFLWRQTFCSSGNNGTCGQVMMTPIMTTDGVNWSLSIGIVDMDGYDRTIHPTMNVTYTCLD
ncbi:hypothetical protein [Pokkaliibacter plantistimulans]|uniref:hypothetical protein n=1 Tax=Pokkaliibacter plantistimulans TaxID=1635171 RepID=UPI0011AFDCE0|nr:hypothetical protein [Pokkaliibacter plantistimulans]